MGAAMSQSSSSGADMVRVYVVVRDGVSTLQYSWLALVAGKGRVITVL